ncbi:MAG: hypothetical protein GY749_22615 [Desulfobacteraceae bacterium]|nr:hypothetical protein [Desulfobacteraceae bacterium]
MLKLFNKKKQPVIIEEFYKKYDCPINTSTTVERLLSGVPQKYLAGLKKVVITDAAGLNREGRRGKIKSRKKKVSVQECRGFYYRPHRGESAWIELYTDNIIGEFVDEILKEAIDKKKNKKNGIFDSIFIRIFTCNVLLDSFFAPVLFHELGHHIHRTQCPEYKEPEDVADNWSKWLKSYYFCRKYWYLRPLAWILNASKTKSLKSNKHPGKV